MDEKRLDTTFDQIFGADARHRVFLGSEMQTGSHFVSVDLKPLWKKLSYKDRLKTIVNRAWQPTSKELLAAAKAILERDVTGGPEDYGDILFRLLCEHNSRKWDLSALSVTDSQRADAFAAHAEATRSQYRNLEFFPPLNLRIARNSPTICLLAAAVFPKISLLSIRYYIEADVRFAMSQIGLSGHQNADDISSWLYEILLLQQKIGATLFDLQGNIADAHSKKRAYIYTLHEKRATRDIEHALTYIKASFEKTLCLIGATHGILNLDSKGSHKTKVNTLTRMLPKEVQESYYYQFILEALSAENIEELVSKRSAILHKRGLQVLSPLAYVGVPASETPLVEQFLRLHHWHFINSLAVLCSFAILADKLVQLGPFPSWHPDPILIANSWLAAQSGLEEGLDQSNGD